jgi:primase-polymerase (primpol)-like protein
MTCDACGLQLHARAGTRFCSTSCRMRAHRGHVVPLRMRRLDRWIRHVAKVPRTVAGRAASSTDPATWSTFDEALASRVGDGLGFVLAADGIACIDLDHCLDGGVLAGWAREILDACGPTYVEVSPSGTGLHVFGRGTVGKGRRHDGAECYDRGRYMTVTGRRFECAPVRLGRIQPALDLI